MAQQFADPRAGARPPLRPQCHERIQHRRRKHTELADIQPPALFELPEVEHVIADRDADARRQPVLCREHAVGEILNREVGRGTDVDEGTKGGVVGMGHSLSCLLHFSIEQTLLRHSGMRHRTRVYPSSAISLSKSATVDLDAQARNPYSLSWLWIPGSRLRRAPE